MRIRAILPLLFLVHASGAQAEEQKDRPVIVVVGTGTASVPAEYGRFSYSVRGEGKSATEALKSLSDIRAKVEAGLNDLDGAESMKIESGTLNVEEARGEGCAPGGPQMSTGNCAVIGYVATLESTAKVTPAKKTGNAMSLAAQNGATNVALGQYGVQNRKSLEAAAAKAAVDDARQQAEAIALAAAEKLGPIISIEDQRTRNTYRPGLQEVIVTASRATGKANPDVALDLGPPPITETANLTVTYGIER